MEPGVTARLAECGDGAAEFITRTGDQAVKTKWTVPHHGVSHLETGRGSERPQFTVAEYDGFTEATHFIPGGGFGDRNPSKTFYGSDATVKAKQWLENCAEMYL